MSKGARIRKLRTDKKDRRNRVVSRVKPIRMNNPANRDKAKSLGL